MGSPTVTTRRPSVNHTMVKRPCPRLLTTSWDETAKVWDPETGECLLTLFPHDAISTRQDYGRLNDAFFSSDGSTIVTFSDTTKIWHATTGVCLEELSTPQGWLSRDQLLSLSYSVPDRTYYVWCVKTGSRLSTLGVQESYVNDAEFSLNGRFVLTAHPESTAKMWSTKTGTCLMTFSGHSYDVASAVFNSDATVVLTSSDDTTAKTWSTTTGTCLLTFTGHGCTLNTAKFSSDDTLVLTSSNDGTAKLWHSISGLCLRTFTGHNEIVNNNNS